MIGTSVMKKLNLSGSTVKFDQKARETPSQINSKLIQKQATEE